MKLFAHAIRRAILGGFLAVVAMVALRPEATALANQAQDAADLVDRSRVTIASMLRDPELPELQRHISDARAVMIFPQIVRGGFIIGGEGGRGVLLVRGADGSWSSPAFYTLAGGSIGLQIGGQVSEAVFTIMNDGAVDAVLRRQIKFGADLSVAAGPMGKGLAASTTANLNADILAFSRTQGLFGGATLDGAALLKRDGANAAYYNAPGVEPHEIVIDRRYFNAQADGLRAALP